MEAAGLRRVVRAEDVAHMGLTTFLRQAPRVSSEYRRLVTTIKNQRPDAAVLIDFPVVNFRLARELRELNVPVVYFVSPQLWAWKRSRLRWVQQRVDRMMVIFPFEEQCYRARGVDAAFVGHPLARLPMPSGTRAEYAARHALNPAKDWVALLPGSRRKEVQLNLPEMLQSVRILNSQDTCEFILPVASTMDRAFLLRFLDNSDIKVVLAEDAREALHHEIGRAHV